MKLLDIDELGALLKRSPETIRKDLRRNHLAVPPRLYIPGTRLLRWRDSDVDAWLAEHVIGGGEKSSVGRDSMVTTGVNNG